MTTTSGRSTVVGVFDDRSRAEQAVQDLHAAGFTNEQIGFATHDGEAARPQSGAPGEHTEAGEGAAKGLIGGGIIGAVLGALATGLIPGIGPVIAGGLLAGIVGGGLVGAAGGGLIGALGGSMGVPEEEARYYDDEFRAGRTIVTVKSVSRYDEAQSILRRYGAYDVSTRPAAATGVTTMQGTTTSPTSPTSPTELDRSVQLREEELQARKTPVQTGQVNIGKDVVEEQRTMDVPVTREEVYVERHPVDRRPSDQPVTVGDQTIDVPVREEHVEVEKQPVVYEEVGVGKRPVTETKQVTETVRREEARIEKEGDVEVGGTGSSETRSS